MKRHVAEAFCHQVITTQFMAGGFPVEGFAAKVLEQRRSRHGDSAGAAYRHRFHHPQRAESRRPARRIALVAVGQIIGLGHKNTKACFASAKT